MQKIIFVADDSDANLTKAKQALEEEYRVFTFPTATKMFALLEKIIPDMIVLDIEMPEIKGDEALVRIKANPAWADIPVIFMTGWNDEFVAFHCLELGALDIVHKPFPNSVMLKRVRNYLDVEEAIKKRVEGSDRLAVGLVYVMSDILEAREKRSTGHVERVAEYTRLLIAALKDRGVYDGELKKWDVDAASTASMLHDVGKIAVPEAILNKSTPLSPDEYSVLWAHASAGERIIDDLIARTGGGELTSHAKCFAGYHHENWDGSGYPYALKGEKIPLEGRILAVADKYDKMVFGSSIHAPVDHERAVEFIQKDANTRLDPKITAVFLEQQYNFERATDAFREQIIM